jgi:hypothetical protein
MRTTTLLLFLLLAATAVFGQKQNANNYRCQDGSIQFSSAAPLEKIEARSSELKGIIDPSKMTFAWVVKINSFEGFNNPLQKEHFRENYMESGKFPTAVFQGKIIEDIDLSKNQKTTIRAKGKLTIHGVEKERIIKVAVEVQDKAITVKSAFTIPLEDHDINIPKIVNQKIAEEVEVKISAKLVKGN